jgi:hypothetical protein
MNPSTSIGVEKELNMRGRILRVRTSEAEFCTIKDIASARGLSMSELVRRSAMGMRMPARLLNQTDAKLIVQLLAQLGRIGGNLNQMVRYANTRKKIGYLPQLSQTLAKINTLRAEIRNILK